MHCKIKFLNKSLFDNPLKAKKISLAKHFISTQFTVLPQIAGFNEKHAMRLTFSLPSLEYIQYKPYSACQPGLVAAMASVKSTPHGDLSLQLTHFQFGHWPLPRLTEFLTFRLHTLCPLLISSTQQIGLQIATFLLRATAVSALCLNSSY